MLSRFGFFPPKPLPEDNWVPLSPALTWLAFGHPMELQPLLQWADQAWVPEDALRQLLTSQWQQLIDYGWTREVRVKAKVPGRGQHERFSRDEWRPFRYVDWWQPSSKSLQLVCVPAQAAVQSALGTLNEPLIWRAEVVAFKKARRRRRDVKTRPDYEGAERDLRLMLSGVEPRTGLKWQYVQVLVEDYDLPEYEAVRLWTSVTQELGFPQRGRPKS